MTWHSFLTQTAEIRRPTLASTDGAPVLVSAAVGCWVMQGRGSHVSERTGERVEASWTGLFPVQTDVRENDEVKVDGVLYDVHFVHPVGRHRQHHLEVDLRRKGSV